MVKDAEREYQKRKAVDENDVLHELSKILAPCRNCSTQEGKEVWKPLPAFLAIWSSLSSRSSVWASTLAHGQDLLCIRCKHDLGHSIPAKVILSSYCNTTKGYAQFSIEMQQAWLNHERIPICCFTCLKTGNTLVDANLSICNGIVCQGQKRPEHQFLQEDITALASENITALELKCVHCKFRAKEFDFDEDRMYECSLCHGNKTLQCMSPSDQKDWLQGGRHKDRWSCLDCRFSALRQLCRFWQSSTSCAATSSRGSA